MLNFSNNLDIEPVNDEVSFFVSFGNNAKLVKNILAKR